MHVLARNARIPKIMRSTLANIPSYAKRFGGQAKSNIQHLLIQQAALESSIQ